MLDRAVGKNNSSHSGYKHFNGEVVSRIANKSIETGYWTAGQVGGAGNCPHHLIDVRNVFDLTRRDFVSEAKMAIEIF